jgi:hypothetical protein
MEAVGGIQAQIGHITWAPKIMVEEFQRRGLKEKLSRGKVQGLDHRQKQGHLPGRQAMADR